MRRITVAILPLQVKPYAEVVYKKAEPVVEQGARKAAEAAAPYVKVRKLLLTAFNIR